MSNTERVQGQMLRFSDYADMQSRGIEEAKIERNFALSIAGKLNYKEAFSITPADTARSVVAQYSHWYKKLTVEDMEGFVMCSNLGKFAMDFLDYLNEKSPGMSTTVNFKELTDFLAMRSLEEKAKLEKQGESVFFSPDARTVAIFHLLAKNMRGMMHEAVGRAIKNHDIEAPEEFRAIAEEAFTEVLNEAIRTELGLAPRAIGGEIISLPR